MKNANAFGWVVWEEALSAANSLASGTIPGLTDGSQIGDWRLPNLRELQSLVVYSMSNPALPNTVGTGQWAEGDPFEGVPAQPSIYWTSTSAAFGPTPPWIVNLDSGYTGPGDPSSLCYVWCVRDGK